jgi:MFS family permease
VAAAICFLNFLFALRALPESRHGASSRPAGSRFTRILQAFTTPVLGLLILLVFLNTFALAHVEATLFLYVRDQFNWSAAVASAGFAYIGVIMVITQGYLIRKLMPTYGERRILLAGIFLSALGFALCSLAAGIGLLAVGVTCLGFGNGMANPSLNSSVSLVSARDVQGNNLGVTQSLSSLARILGPATGGALYQHWGPSSPFALAAIVMCLGGILAWNLRRRLPEGGRVH